MGYTTEFEGKLLFNKQPTAEQIAKINSMTDEDTRDFPSWKKDSEYTSYMDLKVTDDLTGIEWTGAEKTYGMVALVNIIIDEMQKDDPSFGLNGKLKAQGEDHDDSWFLVINDDGRAERREISPVGERVECPHCGESFIPNEKA